MDLIRIYQLFIFISLTIHGTIGEDEDGNAGKCKLEPTDLQSVCVSVYINGDNQKDTDWLSTYFYYKQHGFEYSKYAPTTIKIGAEIVCDENNEECKCPNAEGETDCTVTFKYACVAMTLGQEKFMDFLESTVICLDSETREVKGFQACVDETENLAQSIDDCMQNTGSDGPKQTVINTAKEVIDKGVEVDKNVEPFFFYNDGFTPCVSKNSQSDWLITICLMLEENIFKSIELCVKEQATYDD